MENSLKQRIIGAIVLAALAIIFLPAILKEKASNGPFVSQIPEQPKELREYKVDKNKINRLVADKNKIKDELHEKVKVAESNSFDNEPADTGSSSKRKTKVEAEEADVKPEEIIEDLKRSKIFTESAWIVQVASFAKELNAINLVKKLKSHKFKAYRRKMMVSGQKVFRVYVGPYIEKNGASEAIKEISKVSETEAVIRPFDPINH